MVIGQTESNYSRSTNCTIGMLVRASIPIGRFRAPFIRGDQLAV